ncbi:DNA repair protein rhp54 [Hordeum vulgare]|nr:DNA repair protein rhp54 [Hordeum vulgare]
MPADVLPGARNLFDTMTAAAAAETANRFMETIIFRGGGAAFSEDYDLEKEDEPDIDWEPLFEDELANQAAGSKPKRKSKRTKAYTTAEDKLLCECWRDIGQDPKVDVEQKAPTFWLRIHRQFHERKKFSSYQMQRTCE